MLAIDNRNPLHVYTFKIVFSYWHGLVVSRQTFFNFSSRTYAKKLDLLYIWSKTWTNRHYGSAITPYPVRVHTLYSQYIPHMLYIVPTYHYNGPSRLFSLMLSKVYTTAIETDTVHSLQIIHYQSLVRLVIHSTMFLVSQYSRAGWLTKCSNGTPTTVVYPL